MKDTNELLNELNNKFDKLLELISGGVSFAVSKPVEIACQYTLFEWIEEWFEVYKAPKLKDKGYDLKNTIKKHILPNIANKPLNYYTTVDIIKALEKIDSERMQQVVRQIYMQSFACAVNLEYIEKNPMNNVPYVKHSYKNGRALTITEEREFLDLARYNKCYHYFKFCLFSGARPSEPLNLRWEDIKENTIHIRGTKTIGADRYIPYFENLKNILFMFSKTDEFIFPYSYGCVLKQFNNVRKNLSFSMTLKDLRHTFGSRCLERGVSMKTVQKWLGHSNYNTTANIYSHITSEFEEEERKKVDKII